MKNPTFVTKSNNYNNLSKYENNNKNFPHKPCWRCAGRRCRETSDRRAAAGIPPWSRSSPAASSAARASGSRPRGWRTSPPPVTSHPPGNRLSSVRRLCHNAFWKSGSNKKLDVKLIKTYVLDQFKISKRYRIS